MLWTVITLGLVGSDEAVLFQPAQYPVHAPGIHAHQAATQLLDGTLQFVTVTRTRHERGQKGWLE